MDVEDDSKKVIPYEYSYRDEKLSMVAEDRVPYGEND